MAGQPSGVDPDPADPSSPESGASLFGPTPLTTVSFSLNGVPVVLEGVHPAATLRGWLGTQPGLAGTKAMCWEGGCGCCVVAATRADPVSREPTTVSINSVSGCTWLRSCMLCELVHSPGQVCLRLSGDAYTVCITSL